MSSGRIFAAMYEGNCAAGCGKRIQPDDSVHYNDNDEIVHENCTPKASKFDLAPGEVVCPECWLVKPCMC